MQHDCTEKNIMRRVIPHCQSLINSRALVAYVKSASNKAINTNRLLDSLHDSTDNPNDASL